MNKISSFSLDWYNMLIKPEWTPQPELISLIWTILYPLIFITYAFVFSKVIKKKYPKKTALPFFLNLCFNFAFTPILFGLKNLSFATIDILAVWITILLSMYVVWPKSRWIALLQIPYLVWVSIASILQISILLSN